MSRFFEFRRGDRCVTQNCEAGFTNNDIQVVVVDIDPTRVNARGHSTPTSSSASTAATSSNPRAATEASCSGIASHRFTARRKSCDAGEASREEVLQISAATARLAAMAFDVLVGQRVADGLPVDLGVITDLRERVEDRLKEALAGVEVGVIPVGWSAEDALEQVALRAVIDMLLSGDCAPAALPCVNRRLAPARVVKSILNNCLSARPRLAFWRAALHTFARRCFSAFPTRSADATDRRVCCCTNHRLGCYRPSRFSCSGTATLCSHQKATRHR